MNHEPESDISSPTLGNRGTLDKRLCCAQLVDYELLCPEKGWNMVDACGEITAFEPWKVNRISA